MAHFKTDSERIFAGYLETLGITYHYEPQPAGPDFELTREVASVLCEVSEREGPRLSGGAFGTIRKKIKRKGPQGSGAKSSHPYVLVLHFKDPQSHELDETLFTGAMFGDHRATFDSDGTTVTFSFGGGARLQRNLNTRFSAVASLQVINPTMPELLYRWLSAWEEGRVRGESPDISKALPLGRQIEAECINEGSFVPDLAIARLLVFHNPHAEIPLPRDLFVGPYDIQWGLQGSEYTRVFRGADAVRYDEASERVNELKQRP